MKYRDFLGLAAKNCRCVAHGHPGFYNRPEPSCVYICGKDGSIKSTFCGIAHGTADYLYESVQGYQAMLFYTGANSLEDLLDYNEMLEIIRSFEER